MPRGRSPGYELQRETILARAAELFARRGYTATSMNEVAEACGVSKPVALPLRSRQAPASRRDRRSPHRPPARARRRGRRRGAFSRAAAAAPDRCLSQRLRGLAGRAPRPDRGRPLPRAGREEARPRRPAPRRRRVRRRDRRDPPGDGRREAAEAAGDAALRHDELDVHVAAAEGRAEPCRPRAGRRRPLLRRRRRGARAGADETLDHRNGDSPCPSQETPSSPPVSRRRPRSATSRAPTSTSA